MAEIVAPQPDQFPAFVASLPMNNVPAALEEMDRAINTLGARGVQVCTNVNGRPLDEPAFFPVVRAHHGEIRHADVDASDPARGHARTTRAKTDSKFEIW